MENTCSLCCTELTDLNIDGGVHYSKCSRDHSFCDSCCSAWSRTMTVQQLKGKCTSTLIRCPHYESQTCVGSIHVDEFCSIMSEGGDQVRDVINRAERFYIEDLLEVVSIRCPRQTCHALIDINPDACSAISCGSCGQHFCSCCHARFSCSQQCHLHVPIVHNWRDVFLPRETVVEGQNRIRLVQLKEYLDTLHCDELIEDILGKVARDLEGFNIPTDWASLNQEYGEAQQILQQQRLSGNEIPVMPGEGNIGAVEAGQISEDLFLF